MNLSRWSAGPFFFIHEHFRMFVSSWMRRSVNRSLGVGRSLRYDRLYFHILYKECARTLAAPGVGFSYINSCMRRLLEKTLMYIRTLGRRVRVLARCHVPETDILSSETWFCISVLELSWKLKSVKTCLNIHYSDFKIFH